MSKIFGFLSLFSPRSPSGFLFLLFHFFEKRLDLFANAMYLINLWLLASPLLLKHLYSYGYAFQSYESNSFLIIHFYLSPKSQSDSLRSKGEMLLNFSLFQIAGAAESGWGKIFFVLVISSDKGLLTLLGQLTPTAHQTQAQKLSFEFS